MASFSTLNVFSKEDFEENWTKIGTGSFGQVFKVKHRLWRTIYAIKCCPVIFYDSSFHRKSLQCLMEEAEKMEKIKFQHVVPIYGICDSPEGIVMEYMDNGSLEKQLASQQMSWSLKFQLIHEIALGMNFLHSMKPPLLHLDLKPGNILLDEHFHVKISDFGLSKWMDHSSKMDYIEKSAIRGTLSYIPPEIFLQNSRTSGSKHDIYSFGIVVWEILTQKKPYPGANMMGVIVKVAAGKRPPLEEIPENRPQECEQMINLMQRCWEQIPGQRPCFADITIETDMLMSLVKFPIVAPCSSDKETLIRKASNKSTTSSSRLSQNNEHCSFPSDNSETCESETNFLFHLIQNNRITSEHVSMTFENRYTILHFAVGRGDLEMVRSALSNGADVNAQTVSGYTPLIISVQKRALDMCAFLIEKHADVNLPDEDRWSPLHFAAQNGDDRITRLLLDHHAYVNAVEHDDWTPLHLACQNGFENVARVLILHHADPNIQEKEKKNPLHIAAYYGHFSLVKLLINQRANVNAKQNGWRTPLHIASEKGHYRVVQHLIKSGAVVNSQDNCQYSSLHMAGLKGNNLICKYLIQHGANVDLKTVQGWTPLHLASYKGHVDVIQTLKNSLAKLDIRGDMEWTPLHLATRYGQDAAVSQLLKAGAEPNVVEASGWTPLHLAVQLGSFLSVIQLIQHKADVNARNRFGWTPLHLAALNGNGTIVKILLKENPEINSQDAHGYTPLQIAIRNKKDSVIGLLDGTESTRASSSFSAVAPEMDKL
ncbi:ankyrin repeat and protein kinase domain-containing protein 1 [Protopterus annectens]|uniref:ankyrin repeat and protein kinase domain-containing protein 1 n=1 Tax=Protopterus annectens TaxID=7888 RepID=UPI001CFAAD39|nr:ankyrin repeat and protein kinase domain-containing protein 1 [Protopterus annectens]